jgi:hypothetical protein
VQVLTWARQPEILGHSVLPGATADVPCCGGAAGRSGPAAREQAEAGRWRGGGVARWVGEASGHAQLVSGGGGGAALVAVREPARGWAGAGWRRGARGEVVAARWRLCG